MQVRLMITGGTIDKVYNQSNGELEFDKTHFPEMIKRARIEVNIIPEELTLIDSLDMVDSDRNLIIESCENCAEQFILITHGTDTMCETAKLLGEREIKKTIVLFGSMVPYAVNNSDALFNFGCALGSLQLQAIEHILNCNLYFIVSTIHAGSSSWHATLSRNG